MKWINKFSKRFRFSLCVIDIYCKFAWIVHLKDKEGISNTNAFQKISNEFNLNQTKYGLTKVGILQYRSMKLWLQDNDIEKHSTHTGGKFVVVERFVVETSIPKNVYIDKLDDIVNKYNDTYNNTIKVKPTDVNPSTYID